jgi:hypothetical protein
MNVNAVNSRLGDLPYCNTYSEVFFKTTLSRDVTIEQVRPTDDVSGSCFRGVRLQRLFLYSGRKSGLIRNTACFGFRREAFLTSETVNMSLCLSSTALEGCGHLNASALLSL